MKVEFWAVNYSAEGFTRVKVFETEPQAKRFVEECQSTGVKIIGKPWML